MWLVSHALYCGELFVSVNSNHAQLIFCKVSNVSRVTQNNYCNESNYSNHPVIRTPPFPEKLLNIVFQAFEHSRLKLLFQCLNTYTLQSWNGGCQTSTSLRQSLQSSNGGCQTSTSAMRIYPKVTDSRNAFWPIGDDDEG